MGPRLYRTEVSIIVVDTFIIFITFVTLTDARFPVQFLYFNGPKSHEISISKLLDRPEASNNLNLNSTLKPTDEQSGISPSLPVSPFELVEPPPLPQNLPPFCVNPPFSPQPPSTLVPSPTSHQLSPPPPHVKPNFPIQSPPPSPPMHAPNPKPPQYEPSPPCGVRIPPCHGPSPPKQIRSPPVHQPPIVYLPPSAPPPSHKGPQFAVWCVAKPTVPDSILQEALDYACGSGADCKSIQPNGPCFQPDTLFAHASYAFNSYWQNKKAAGGTCDFGGTAMLVTVDPSFNDCYFIYK